MPQSSKMIQISSITPQKQQVWTILPSSLDDIFIPFGRKWLTLHQNSKAIVSMKHFWQLTLATLFIFSCISASAKDYTVASPKGKNVVTVGKDLKILVKHNDREIVKSEFTALKVRVYRH